MDLREIVNGQPSVCVLQRKHQQSERIAQSEAENEWFRDQLARTGGREDKASQMKY